MMWDANNTYAVNIGRDYVEFHSATTPKTAGMLHNTGIYYRNATWLPRPVKGAIR